jgi:hypothetical protein
VPDFVRPLPATTSLNLPSYCNFNDRMTAENSIARLTHSAYCSAPCVESSYGTFMRHLSD